MRYHRFDFPDLPIDAFKHYGDRRIKPQGGGGGGFVNEFLGNPLGTTIDVASNIIDTAVKNPLQTAALVAAAFVAPELIAAMGSEAAAAEAAIGLSEAEQLALASQVAAEAELGGVAGSAAVGAEALPAVAAPSVTGTIEAPIETTPSAPTTAPVNAPIEPPNTGPFVQSDSGIYTPLEEATNTAPATDLPEPPPAEPEWTPPENLPPADTPTGIDAEGAQPPISTDQTDQTYQKFNNIKKQIANDLVKKGIPLSSAVNYANSLGQTTSSQPTIQQTTSSGGTTLSPLNAQYLTSKAGTTGFVNPLSTYQQMVAKDVQAPPAQQPVQQATRENAMPNYYNYGSNQSIDDIFGFGSQFTAKEGGMVTPLMASGGSVQKYAEGGLSVPLMNHGGKMRGDFRHGAHVAGPGDGQSDDIPAMLADGEYVLDSEIVAALGNGSTKAGSKLLDKFRQEIRAHKRSGSINSIPPKSKSPLQYLADAKKKMGKK